MNSTRRKLAIATWSAPSEGNIFGKLTVDVSNALMYLEHVRTTSGEKVTLTHLVGKAVANALAQAPSLNGRIVWGTYVEHKTVDVTYLVVLEGGKDLAKAKVPEADKKTVAGIAQSLSMVTLAMLTLIMLTLIMLAAFAAQAGLDHARAGVLAAANVRLDRLLAGRTFAAMMRSTIRTGQTDQRALRDLDSCRQFIGGSGITALLDIPWMPLYVLITFALHWAIGLYTLFCAIVLVGLAVVSERRLRPRRKRGSARVGRLDA